MGDCIFCKIVKNESLCWKVYEDELVIAIFDAFPASEYHTLVIPKKHFRDIYNTEEEYLKRIILVCKKLAIQYKEHLGINNINLIHGSGKFAQQDVFHFHMHIVPRHKGDDYKLHYNPKMDIRKKFDELLKRIRE